MSTFTDKFGLEWRRVQYTAEIPKEPGWYMVEWMPEGVPHGRLDPAYFYGVSEGVRIPPETQKRPVSVVRLWGERADWMNEVDAKD